MVIDLPDKVRNVLKMLEFNHFRVAATNSAIRAPTQKVATVLVNELRDLRGINTKMYASNLSAYLHNPGRAPSGFLEELTASLGLDELGFDESLWEQDTETIQTSIEGAIHGGVLAKVLEHPIDPNLFRISSRKGKGIAFPEPELAILRQFHNYPELLVKSGEALQCQSTMPFDGFLHVIAYENGEYMGLNDLLGISNSVLRVGNYKFEPIVTNPLVARTIIFSFASEYDIFSNWPKIHYKSGRLTHGKFLSLVMSFYESSGPESASSVQSFITTVNDVE